MSNTIIVIKEKSYLVLVVKVYTIPSLFLQEKYILKPVQTKRIFTAPGTEDIQISTMTVEMMIA